LRLPDPVRGQGGCRGRAEAGGRTGRGAGDRLHGGGGRVGRAGRPAAPADRPAGPGGTQRARGPAVPDTTRGRTTAPAGRRPTLCGRGRGSGGGSRAVS